MSLDGLTLVFFNGNDDTAYRVITLDGNSPTPTDSSWSGIRESQASHHVSPSATLQNGADAVALYSGPFLERRRGDHDEFGRCDCLRYRTMLDDAGIARAARRLASRRSTRIRTGRATTQSSSRVPDGGDPRRTSDVCCADADAGCAQRAQRLRRADHAERIAASTSTKAVRPTATRLRCKPLRRPT